MEKSSVKRADMPAAVCLRLTWKMPSFAADRILQPKQEYGVGEKVKVSVLEDGVRKPKKMEVARAQLGRDKWEYQIKPVGGGDGEAMHQDENGNDWFTEDQLEWW